MGFGKIIKLVALLGTSGTCVFALKKSDWSINHLGITRFGRAAFTVASIAYDYKTSFRNIDKDSLEALPIWSSVHTRSANKLLDLCSINGGVFIKVGQHIAALEYLVPQEYVSVLCVLHSRAPQSSIDQIKAIIKSDLGKEPEELFKHFSDKPIGTASLAQVHKAVLNDGTELAVKVQHPKVKAHSFIDMATMELLVRIIDKIFPDFSLLWLANETKRNLPLELDFLNEGRNSEKAEKMFSHLKWFKVPKIKWEFCSSRILTMEYLEGGFVTDRKYMKDNGINCFLVSKRIGQLYSEMIFLKGYIHCDPHPGNILIRKHNGEPQIILLDHGLYTTLPEKFRLNYSKLWLSMINSDLKGINKYGKELGAGNLSQLLACIVSAKTWNTIVSGMTKNFDKSHIKSEKENLKEQVKSHIPEITIVLSRVPREMLLVLKTNDLLRGIETQLGTLGEKVSLLTMSRFCVESVYQKKIQDSYGILSIIKINLMKRWFLMKISMYHLYLWFTGLFRSTDYS